MKNHSFLYTMIYQEPEVVSRYTKKSLKEQDFVIKSYPIFIILYSFWNVKFKSLNLIDTFTSTLELFLSEMEIFYLKIIPNSLLQLTIVQ